MLADLQAGNVNAVVVYSLDRLTRKPSELETFISLADTHGIDLANVSGDVDLSTAAGRMVARIMGSVARHEAERLGERVSRQKQQRAELGKSHNGGAYRSFGYDREWNVLEEEAALLRDAYVRVAAGESVASIVKAWNDKGIHTSAGNPWRRRTLQTMLQRPAYAGLSSYKGEVVGKTEHDAIVDEALWQAAQDMMDSRTEAYQGNPGRNGRVWLLSGIAVCGSCKMPMYGSSSKGGVYRCVKTDGGCGSMRIKARWLDHIAQVEAAKAHAKNPPQAAPQHDYKADLEVIDKRIQDLRDANAQGDLDLADLIPLLKAERTKRADVLRQTQAVEHPIFQDMKQSMEAWWSGSVSQRRVIVTRHIKALMVNPSDKPGRRVFDASRVTIIEQNGKTHVSKARKPMSDKAKNSVYYSIDVPIKEGEDRLTALRSFKEALKGHMDATPGRDIPRGD
jgi:DNA invertase Pin-like site-specific DNA recombinase